MCKGKNKNNKITKFILNLTLVWDFICLMRKNVMKTMRQYVLCLHLLAYIVG